MGFLKASTAPALFMLTLMLFSSPSRSTVTWDESINGNLSNNQAAPNVFSVPEPSTPLLFALGIAALCSAQLLKRRQTERSPSGPWASVLGGGPMLAARQQGESVVWSRGIPMTSYPNRLVIISATVVAGLLLCGVASAMPLAATATISAAPNPDGVHFDYTIKLTDTGTTDIGTFWFAWTPPGQPVEYGFLPSSPLSTNQPAGWVAVVIPQFPGTSIDFQNLSGSAVSPGQTATFDFTSSDSPAKLQGLALGVFPITESFIYSGAPFVGTPAQVNPAFVPEPASGLLSALGLIGMVAWDRRRQR